MAGSKGPEPDKAYTTPISRRKALALGGSGLASGLAGCNEVSESFAGDPSDSSPDQGTGDNGNDGDGEETPDDGRIVDIQPGSITLKMNPRRFDGALENGNSFEYALQIHSTPVFSESRSVVEETTITVAEWGEEFEIDYEFSDELLGYGQQLRVTLQALDYDEEPWEVEAVDKREGPSGPKLLDTVLLPFYNEAEGEEMVSVRGPPEPIQDEWTDDFTSIAQTEVWFNEPEESLWNRVDHEKEQYQGLEITEERFPKEWYGEWTDLQITMVVRYPVYEVMESDDRDKPLYDWAVFNFDMTDIELIEARRWNSFVVQQLERGRYELSEDGKTATDDNGTVRDGHNSEGSLMTSTEFYSGDAADTPTPFSEYYRSRYGNATTSADQINANPIKLAGGRPVMKRWANEIESSLAGNPNFQEHEAHEYYKATIVKAIVGNVPYSFSVGDYTQTPEEVISNWYQNQGDSDALGGNCVDASALFCGVCIHLLDTTIGLLYVDADRAGHVQACMFGRETPSYLPPSVNNQNAVEPLSQSNTQRYTDDDYGDFMPVECNYPGSVIGYVGRWGANTDIDLQSFASNIDINSHLALDDDYMPDADGEILADRDPTQNTMLFRMTVTNPSAIPYFEQQ